MTEIKFSIYGDQPSPLEDHAFLLREFQSQQHATVSVTRLTWDEAWPKLLNYALYGGGPHISQIGAIWTSTLVAMNALWPFTAQEIERVGGTAAFFASTWQNALLPDRPGVWGIPFTAFTYVVLYRRDLLKQAHIAEETAFESAEAMTETLKRLRAVGISSPVVLPSGGPYRARVHVAAGWLWGAGGDFVSDDGHQVLFDQPAARAGLSAFFELYRFLSPADYNLTYNDCLQRFATGESAVTIASSGSPAVIASGQVSQVVDNLGVTVVPGVPWIGGSNLVVWREAQMSPNHERAATSLARFLTAPAAQIKYATASNAIPARSEALRSPIFKSAAATEVVERALQTGRAYKPVLLWVRMLNELRQSFDAVTAEILADTSRNMNELLDEQIAPLAQRFNLMLSR